MPCFCTVPPAALTNRFDPRIIPILPTVPLSLRMAVAMPMLGPATRLDMHIDTGFDPTVLPNIDFGGGALAQLAMSFSMMMGTFTLDDLPQLELDMQQAAESFNHNLWPRLNWLPEFKLQPLLNFALAARLVIDLEALGIDPFVTTAIPPGPVYHDFRFRLRPPKVKMARIMAGLPQLLQLSPALDIPPLGDPGAVSALRNRLDGLAQLTPPKLIVPMPILMKMALVLESLATIEEAFGDEAFSPSRLGRIETMMRMWGTFRLPIPLPALALTDKLDLLPTMEDIRLGEQMVGSGTSGLTPILGFSPPKLAIMPFLNAMIALSASMEMMLDMEPFDMCSMCSCP